MTNIKTAIGTITGDGNVGTMTIYFNGDNQPMTAEVGDMIEEFEYIPKNLEEAIDYVYDSYSYGACWNLEMNEDLEA